MEPWNASTGRGEAEEKPAQKWATAGAERVPPAPWVKIRGVWVVEVGGWDVVSGAY